MYQFYCYSSNMTPSECFIGVDCILVVSASQIFINKSWLRGVMIILFLLQLFQIIVEYVEDIRVFFNNPNLYTSTIMVYYPCVIVFKISLVLKSHQIKDYFSQLVSQLNEKEHKSIRRLSWLGLAIFILISISFIIGFITVWMTDDFSSLYGKRYGIPHSRVGDFISRIIFDQFQTTAYTWETTAIITYTFVYYTKYRVLATFFTTLSVDLNRVNHISSNQITLIFSQIQRMTQLNKRFTDLFSLYPFLWLAYRFFSAAGYVNSTSHISSNSYALGDMVVFVISTCLSLIGIYMTSSLDERISEKTRGTIQVVNMTTKKFSDTSSPVRLIVCLRDFEADMIPSIYGLFNMNKSLILNFMGSILTFAVLFKQMAENKI